jgi:hypothetical protein
VVYYVRIFLVKKALCSHEARLRRTVMRAGESDTMASE